MEQVAAADASWETDLGRAASLEPAERIPFGEDDALARLTALLQEDITACNHTIVARMDSPVVLIPQLAAHIVAAGGKRLRPLLTLAAARLCGYPGPREVRGISILRHA